MKKYTRAQRIDLAKALVREVEVAAPLEAKALRSMVHKMRKANEAPADDYAVALAELYGAACRFRDALKGVKRVKP